MHRAIFYEWHAAAAPERVTHRTEAGEVTITLVGSPAEVPPLATRLVAYEAVATCLADGTECRRRYGTFDVCEAARHGN